MFEVTLELIDRWITEGKAQVHIHVHGYSAYHRINKEYNYGNLH